MFSLSVLFFIILINLNEIFSAPVDNSKTVALYNEYKLNPNGNYYYKYNLSDGQAVDVTGQLKEVDGTQIYEVKGFYTFEGTDGNVYTVNFVADENGYRIDKSDSRYYTTPRPTQPFRPAAAAAPTVPPLKPGAIDEINPRTIAGTFG